MNDIYRLFRELEKDLQVSPAIQLIENNGQTTEQHDLDNTFTVLNVFSNIDYLVINRKDKNAAPDTYPAIQGVRYIKLTHGMLNLLDIPARSILRDYKVVLVISEAIFDEVKSIPDEFNIVIQYINEAGQALYTRITGCLRLLHKGGTSIDTIVGDKVSYCVAKTIEENIHGVSAEHQQYSTSETIS